MDPTNNLAARLFHPRTDSWQEHFTIVRGRIEGITAEGRATARVLQFNRRELVELRLLLIAEGRYP
jgi:hypothetical protein